jgi:hypothetical protein
MYPLIIEGLILLFIFYMHIYLDSLFTSVLLIFLSPLTALISNPCLLQIELDSMIHAGQFSFPNIHQQTRHINLLSTNSEY